MKYGQFFCRETGVDPTELGSTLDIEQVAEEHLGKKMGLRSFRSNMLSSGGNVFPVVDHGDLDNMIDLQLEKMHRCHGE